MTQSLFRNLACRSLLMLLMSSSHAEVSVDLLYDYRHLTDPKDNRSNLPVGEIKLFLPESFGSLLMKEEIDFAGADHNESQVYTELSQSLRLGDATLAGSPLYAHVGYSGGLGLFSNASGGFYIRSAFIAGLEYPFELLQAFCNVYVALRRTSFTSPSYDPMFAAYSGRYFLGKRLFIANSLEAWTTSRGDNASGEIRPGKIASWELETELWYQLAGRLSAGTYVRTTRNVYASSNRWLIYPSMGLRYLF